MPRRSDAFGSAWGLEPYKITFFENEAFFCSRRDNTNSADAASLGFAAKRKGVEAYSGVSAPPPCTPVAFSLLLLLFAEPLLPKLLRRFAPRCTAEGIAIACMPYVKRSGESSCRCAAESGAFFCSLDVNLN